VIRVVLDANVLISAILFGGRPRQILEKTIRGDIQLCLSEPILEEFKGVLRRRKFNYSPEEVHVIVTELIGISDFIHPSEAIHVVSEDVKDNRILECAVEGGASYIVTGDVHLLKLGGYRDIKILNANAFLDKISSEK
jgi:putative PIN family toxin of toxin-antitoxin system